MAARFSFVDLLVSVAIVFALGVAGLAARRSAQENSVIIACAANLGQIGQSLVLYESLHDGQFPRTRYDPASPHAAYTAPDAPDPFAANGPAANDVTACLFLLARVIDVPAKTFVCPSAVRLTLAEPDTFDRRTARLRSNFRGRVNSSYAVADPYPDAAVAAGGYTLDHFRDRLPAGFVVAGDLNPGGDGPRVATTQMSRGTIRLANSPNHERDGENLLFADASVRFYNAPFEGLDYDNVYASRDGGLRARDRGDTVLLPTWADGPQTRPEAAIARWVTLSVAAVVTIAVMTWIVARGVRRANVPRGTFT